MREDSERGIVLVTALWVVMLLALFAFVVVETTRTERHIGRNVSEQARLQAAVESGISRAIIAILDRQVATPWPIEGTFVKFSYAGVNMTVAIEDEFGKIDLNAATGEMLARLFVAAKLSEPDARALADAIEDWRDKDDLHHTNGAEHDDYRKDNLPYGPRNAAFESTAELLQVRGVTPELFTRVRSALSVHSMRQFVDPHSAPAAAWGALIDQAGAKLAPIQRDGGPRSSSASIVALAGRAFKIHVHARAATGEAAYKYTIIRFTDDAKRPYWIQEWQ